VTLFLIDQEKRYVYVLKLRSRNKYYVGYSSALTKRLDSHNKGKGAEYTKKHGVEKIVALVECNDPGRAKEIESILTEFYQKVYGKRNVRGGGYTDSRDPEEFESPQVMSDHKSPQPPSATDKSDKPHNCEECGRPIRYRGRCMGCNIRAKKEKEAKKQ
jgi:predicted GIY-YIG superfamily endonuclease